MLTSLQLLDALHVLVNVLRVPLADASAMLSSSPARRVGLTHTGRIEVGLRADLLLLSEQLVLERTMVAGISSFERAQ